MGLEPTNTHVQEIKYSFLRFLMLAFPPSPRSGLSSTFTSNDASYSSSGRIQRPDERFILSSTEFCSSEQWLCFTAAKRFVDDMALNNRIL